MHDHCYQRPCRPQRCSFALLRRTHPTIWQRLLDTLSEDERAAAIARAGRGNTVEPPYYIASTD